MKQEAETVEKPALLFIDTTLLRFAGDLRGIPQVVFILLQVFSEPFFRGRIRYLAYPDVAEKYLLPRGVAPADIVLVSSVPVLGKRDRFHGLFSTWRYRHAVRGAAVLFHPEPRSMTRLRIPQVVAWYDFLQVAPDWKPWKKPSRYLFTLYKYRLAMHQARGITISEHTKREALRLFPKTNPSRLTPLWLGARASLAPGSPPRIGPLTLPLRCVYVGALEARKNIFNLIDGLTEIFGELPFTLDLVGKYFEREGEQARRSIAAHPRGGSVSLRGLLSEADLREVMDRSDVTLFPSLAEGFGLPIVEAMTHGHVVFAFNNTSIPELGGDAVVLAENNDFAAWGRELKRLVGDPAACTDLRQRALDRSRLFSESAMRKRYHDYFQEVLSRAEDGRHAA